MNTTLHPVSTFAELEFDLILHPEGWTYIHSTRCGLGAYTHSLGEKVRVSTAFVEAAIARWNDHSDERDITCVPGVCGNCCVRVSGFIPGDERLMRVSA